MTEATNPAVLTQAPATSEPTPSLLLRGLKKAFADVRAVDSLDLEVPRGECFGLLGPNGAGKTTTIEICEGLTAPDAGTVELLGLNWRSNSSQLRQRIGIQLQETQFPEKLTVLETLRLFRSFFRRGIPVENPSAPRSLKKSATPASARSPAAKSSASPWPAPWSAIPSCSSSTSPPPASIPRPAVTSGTSSTHLKHAGRTIILTTHYMDEAERLCDRVAIMDHGRVIALGTPQQLIATVGGEHIVEFAVAGQPSPSLPALPP